MKVKDKEVQIVRIERKTRVWSTSPRSDAETIFRVISRITHFQEKGEQRRTKKSRREIEAQVVANIGEALRVL